MKRPEVDHLAGPLVWREECRPTGADTWKVEPYGFLDSFEVDLMEPIPNMNAHSYVELRVELRVDGAPVNARSRSVLDRR